MLKHPCARAHPGCEVNCQGVPNQLASSLHLCFVEASLTVKKAVSCYKAERFVASLSSFCTVQLSLPVCRYDAAGGRTLQMRPQTVVYKPLMSDVVAPKVHHNNSSYVSPVDLPLGSLCKNSAWWAVTRRTSKKIVKIGWWALAWDNMVIPEKGRCGMTAIFNNCYVNSSCASHIFTSLLHMYCIPRVIRSGCSCQILLLQFSNSLLLVTALIFILDTKFGKMCEYQTVGFCLAIKSLNWIVQSGMSGGDNKCGSELLGVTFNKLVYIPQIEQHSHFGLCCSVWEG